MELTPIEKSRLQYMRLYEEQILFKANKLNRNNFFNQLITWLTK